MKKLILAISTMLIMVIGVSASDKSFNYDIISYCKHRIGEDGKNNLMFAGVVTGLGQAYIKTMHRKGIDNQHAHLSPGEYGTTICKLTLNYRKNQNKETGGKYDVTQFYDDLITMGYFMSLPPENDTNTTN